MPAVGRMIIPVNLAELWCSFEDKNQCAMKLESFSSVPYVVNVFSDAGYIEAHFTTTKQQISCYIELYSRLKQRLVPCWIKNLVHNVKYYMYVHEISNIVPPQVDVSLVVRKFGCPVKMCMNCCVW